MAFDSVQIDNPELPSTLTIHNSANVIVERRRKEIGGESPFDACSQAIDEAVAELRAKLPLGKTEIEKLYLHLHKTFLEPLAAAEHKATGRTDWGEKR